MNKTDIAVTLYDTHAEAESSIKTLQQQVSATSMPVIVPSFLASGVPFGEARQVFSDAALANTIYTITLIKL